ncbi:hypothetical protein KIV56_04525 [Cryobacterium breve]|uniref:Uncharacterized protein n=1 Tax=Cryobacterium breve TaxID=1259258 RepID=A0ABY7NJI0_9MICO|nr:hypothetical protein [Cryobacterium breve]WBM80668.1 hypothetical protein KIV56_04525 [Cryobacterium breve]
MTATVTHLPATTFKKSYTDAIGDKLLALQPAFHQVAKIGRLQQTALVDVGWSEAAAERIAASFVAEWSALLVRGAASLDRSPAR